MTPYAEGLVEAMAKAGMRQYWQAIYGDEIGTIERMTAEHWHTRKTGAEAALIALLSALETPSTNMVEAAWVNGSDEDDATPTWQVMIQALRRELTGEVE